MNDTSPEIAEMIRLRYLAMSPVERLEIGARHGRGVVARQPLAAGDATSHLRAILWRTGRASVWAWQSSSIGFNGIGYGFHKVRAEVKV